MFVSALGSLRGSLFYNDPPLPIVRFFSNLPHFPPPPPLLLACAKNFRVALCERDKFGGTCLNRGCTPSKMLIHAAELADSIHEFPRFGIDLEKRPSIRFSDIVHRVSHVIDEESSEYLREVWIANDLSSLFYAFFLPSVLNNTFSSPFIYSFFALFLG